MIQESHLHNDAYSGKSCSHSIHIHRVDDPVQYICSYFPFVSFFFYPQVANYILYLLPPLLSLPFSFSPSLFSLPHLNILPWNFYHVST